MNYREFVRQHTQNNKPQHKKDDSPHIVCSACGEPFKRNNLPIEGICLKCFGDEYRKQWPEDEPWGE